jgi:hypothetical protein
MISMANKETKSNPDVMKPHCVVQQSQFIYFWKVLTGQINASVTTKSCGKL